MLHLIPHWEHLRTARLSLAFALVVCLLLVLSNDPKSGHSVSELDEATRLMRWIDHTIDNTADDFLASNPMQLKSKVAAKRSRILSVQQHVERYMRDRIWDDGSSQHTARNASLEPCRALSLNGRCTLNVETYSSVKDASVEICSLLSGKRILFVGPETTYHLHDIWLQALEAHTRHSLYCPGAEFCVFHHICSSFFDDQQTATPLHERKQKVPSNQKLRDTQSSILQFVLSSTLVSLVDPKDAVYTRPTVDPNTGTRTLNDYWLRKAQKAHVIVMNRGPVPAPSWTYSPSKPGGNWTLVSGSRPPKTSQITFSFEEKIMAAAMNITIATFLPTINRTLHTIELDREIQDSVIVWHGSWFLDARCVSDGMLTQIPRLHQVWSLDDQTVDPWSFYYNAQVYIHNRLLPRILPSFGIIFLPLIIPQSLHPDFVVPTGAAVTEEYNHENRKDCIRKISKRKRALEVAFFSGLTRLLNEIVKIT